MSKYCIITGGNAGMGLLTAISLARLSYHVTITVRNEVKGVEALKEIKQSYPEASIDFAVMDLTDLSSVRSFADAYNLRPNPLNLLVNNAGIMNTPFGLTVDGFEQQFQVNHLAHFLLVHLLFKKLGHSVGISRVVNLSSRAHLRWQEPLNMNDVKSVTADNYDGWNAYGRSKCCNILFSREFAKRYPAEESGIVMNALHPGLVNTSLLTNANLSEGTIASSISVEDGIKTTMFLATSEEVEGISGKYFFENKVVEGSEISSFAQSDVEAETLWYGSIEMCGLSPDTFGKH